MLSGVRRCWTHWQEVAFASVTDRTAARGELPVGQVLVGRGSWYSLLNRQGPGNQVCLTKSLWARLENGKDDFRVRCEDLEKEVQELQRRNEELTSLAEEAQSLKDEMDVLR